MARATWPGCLPDSGINKRSLNEACFQTTLHQTKPSDLTGVPCSSAKLVKIPCSDPRISLKLQRACGRIFRWTGHFASSFCSVTSILRVNNHWCDIPSVCDSTHQILSHGFRTNVGWQLCLGTACPSKRVERAQVWRLYTLRVRARGVTGFVSLASQFLPVLTRCSSSKLWETPNTSTILRRANCFPILPSSHISTISNTGLDPHISSTLHTQAPP